MQLDTQGCQAKQHVADMLSPELVQLLLGRSHQPAQQQFWCLLEPAKGQHHVANALAIQLRRPRVEHAQQQREPRVLQNRSQVRRLYLPQPEEGRGCMYVVEVATVRSHQLQELSPVPRISEAAVELSHAGFACSARRPRSRGCLLAERVSLQNKTGQLWLQQLHHTCDWVRDTAEQGLAGCAPSFACTHSTLALAWGAELWMTSVQRAVAAVRKVVDGLCPSVAKAHRALLIS